MGIGKSDRYGKYIARQGSTLKEFEGFIKTVSQSGDVLKIILTGLIDFETGRVKGRPQFTLEEMRYIVAKANDFDLATMTHCSGTDGLDIAIEAGVDSIEHGFFMNKDHLRKMRDKHICWVPTFIPVQFQYDNPQYAGWSEDVLMKLRGILEDHRENLLYARDIGISVFVGSDAGSFGVSHGKGFLEELFLMHKMGIGTEELLSWATVKPREKWHWEDNSIRKGSRADLLLLDANPYENIEVLNNPKGLSQLL